MLTQSVPDVASRGSLAAPFLKLPYRSDATADTLHSIRSITPIHSWDPAGIQSANLFMVSEDKHAVSDSRRESDRSDFRWMPHVYAAFALAFIAPMYGRLEHRPRVLMSQEPVTIWIFLLVWSVIIPGLLLSVLAVWRRRNQKSGTLALQILVGTCCTVFLLAVRGQVVQCVPKSAIVLRLVFGWLMILLCFFVGYIVAKQYPRRRWMQSLLAIAAIGALAYPASLLWSFHRVSARPTIGQTLTAQNRVPVVVVVFDCLCGMSLMDQNRQIDANRYENFAKLAATSNWYRNCTSVHPRTAEAVPAILSGERPHGNREPAATHNPQNLFSLLNATGYQLTSFEPFTLLCPPDTFRDRAWPDSWTQWIGLTRTVGIVFLHDIVPSELLIELPDIPRNWFGLEHALMPDRQQRQGLIRYGWDAKRDIQFHHFLDCLSATDQPNLWFGHFALPHSPWCHLPSGHLYCPDAGFRFAWGAEGQQGEDWVDDELAVLQAHQQHLLQLGYTDKLVGDLIDRLRRVGLFDRCLLVVVADHGVSFRAGLSGRHPTEKSLADILSVPLFVKLPNQHVGDVIDLSVETIDVLPTILDIIKLTPPTPLVGQSLISEEFVERPTKQFSTDSRQFAIDASFESRNDVLIEHLARFGTGADPLRIFRIGPHADLLGRRVADLRVEGKSPMEVRPVNFSPAVDHGSSRIVPSLLEARIHAASNPQGLPQFAIAVNDTIWGTTQLYKTSYLKDYWRVMLPESAFLQGTNHIRVFQIQETADGLHLAECPFGSVSQGPDLPIKQ